MERGVLTGFAFFPLTGLVRSLQLNQPHTYTMSFTTLHCDFASSASLVDGKQQDGVNKTQPWESLTISIERFVNEPCCG